MKTDLRRRVAPGHLSKDSAGWWRSVVREFEIDDSQMKLLTLAAESWDMSRKAYKTLAKQGFTFGDKHKQPRERPEVRIYKDALSAFARLLKQLQLDIAPPADEPE